MSLFCALLTVANVNDHLDTYCAGNGCDWAAVLYRCAIDENAYEGSTVNVNKQ